MILLTSTVILVVTLDPKTYFSINTLVATIPFIYTSFMLLANTIFKPIFT